MIGKILGFDVSRDTGVISTEDGKRYEFSKEEFKDSSLPKKDMKVDFEIEDNKAKVIYLIKDVADDNNRIMGLIAILITFFLGFIGTFISRLALAKEPVSSIIVPTLIHFIITVLFVVPVLGWIIYIIGTAYYMYKNYLLVIQEK